MTSSRKRWPALAGACGAIFWPGVFIFALPGVLGESWTTAFEVGRTEVGRVMFFLLAGVGSFMYLVGRWQEKAGTRRMALLGISVTGLSTMALGLAAGIRGVYVWAFLVGAASAFVYIPGLTVAQLLFPERRGLVSGLVNTAFGLSAAIMSPISGLLLAQIGSRALTTGLGAAALVFGLPAAFFVAGPEKNDGAARAGSNETRLNRQSSMTVVQGVGSRPFWCMWFMWALAGSAGISMVVLSTAFGMKRGLSAQEAILILSAFNLTNGAGRLLSGYLSDRLGRRMVMGVAFAVAGLAYWAMSWVQGVTWWAFLAALVGYAFGALFAVSAPLAGERFGMAHFGSIFGLIFTAYGFFAGALGPWLSGVILDRTGGDFRIVFGYLGGFFILASCLTALMGPKPTAVGFQRTSVSTRA